MKFIHHKKIIYPILDNTMFSYGKLLDPEDKEVYGVVIRTLDKSSLFISLIESIIEFLSSKGIVLKISILEKILI